MSVPFTLKRVLAGDDRTDVENITNVLCSQLSDSRSLTYAYVTQLIPLDTDSTRLMNTAILHWQVRPCQKQTHFLWS